jgi:hypothetical protein
MIHILFKNRVQTKNKRALNKCLRSTLFTNLEA